MSTRNNKTRVRTLEPLNAFDRDKRLWEIRNSYSRGKRPPQPRTKHELDVLRERHQFVRSSDVDPSTLSWEDQLASKYYDSLFKEFAIVNLKHWRSGQIGLRWRTEDEVLAGIGHVTCASLRCAFHSPDPSLVAERQLARGEDIDEPLIVDPDSSLPLVRTALEESEMNFGYIEEGVKKSTMVKVVLCRECGKKLRRGREQAKAEREQGARTVATPIVARVEGARENSRDRGDKEESGRRESRGEGSPSCSHREGSPKGLVSRRKRHGGAEDEEEDYTPALPPDLERARSQAHRPRESARRRSASPASRHR